MAGGIFITQNKIRPGFYHKFTAKQKERQLFGELGVVALPLELDWGKAEMFSLDSDGMNEEYLAATGYDKGRVLLIKEAAKRARKILVYRVNAGGSRAKLDMIPQPISCEAVCAGTRGNDIAVQIVEDENNMGRYIVSTYVDSILMYEQKGIANSEDILSNEWVEFSGSGAIMAAAGGQLVDGTNSSATKKEYAQFLTALESCDFNAYALMSDDVEIKEMFAIAAKRFVEELGKMVQCVLADYSAGYEAVTSIKNGVVLEDGTIINSKKATAWFAGAAAAAGPAHSLTYREYDGAVKPDKLLSDGEIKQAIKDGHVVFVAQKDRHGEDIAVVEQDIDTLTRYSEHRPKEWSKNRVVRSLYYLIASLSRVWHLYYIGKVDNNSAGRNLFKADLVTMMRELVDQGAFENFDAEHDIRVEKGDASDAVVCHMAVEPVDAMEKMYFTVEVK